MTVLELSVPCETLTTVVEEVSPSSSNANPSTTSDIELLERVKLVPLIVNVEFAAVVVVNTGVAAAAPEVVVAIDT
jgi:hypothetical protein